FVATTKNRPLVVSRQASAPNEAGRVGTPSLRSMWSAASARAEALRLLHPGRHARTLGRLKRLLAGPGIFALRHLAARSSTFLITGLVFPQRPPLVAII